MRFQDMYYHDEFDGIWASASLLLVSYEETNAVYEKMHHALKRNGIFYGSYKYGTDYMPSGERDFWNMSETAILPYFEGFFEVIDMWKEDDSRSRVSSSSDLQWLNFVVRKISK